jgi:hypothetical protein
MKKLKLEIETLRVESFETASSVHTRGTVNGHDATQVADTCDCDPIPTDACSMYGCVQTYTCDLDGDTEPDRHSNNCWTIIEY